MLNNKAQIMLDKLSATYLSKGVQPCDIASIMFEENYTGLEINKTSTSLVMTFSFEELNEDNQPQLITMKHSYNKNMYLQEISQKVGKGRYKVQWNRTDNLRNVANKLILAINCDKQLDLVLRSLPSDIRDLFHQHKAA